MRGLPLRQPAYQTRVRVDSLLPTLFDSLGLYSRRNFFEAIPDLIHGLQRHTKFC